LRHLLHDAMEWKNHVRPVANGQPLLHVNACALQCFHFIEQRLGIDYDTVSDHGLDAGTQDATRDQLQNEFLIADEDRVAGIVAPLIAHHDGKLFREKINDLSFAFIAPLSAQNYDISHGSTQNVSLYLGRDTSERANYCPANVTLTSYAAF